MKLGEEVKAQGGSPIGMKEIGRFANTGERDDCGV